MTLRRAGFFKELDHGDPDGPSLHAALGNLDVAPEPVAAYLEGAVTLAVASSSFDDVVTGREAVGALSIKTDGEWQWPSSLGYYVREYRVGLPGEFLAHCERHGWKPRLLTHEELLAVTEALIPPHPASDIPPTRDLFTPFPDPQRLRYEDVVGFVIGQDLAAEILHVDGSGHVVARAPDGASVWFINASLEQYRASLALVGGFREGADHSNAAVARLRRELEETDGAALTPGAYWHAILEQIEHDQF